MFERTNPYSQQVEATKKVYQIEQQIVEQEAILGHIRRFVEIEALSQEMHQVEENLFRMLLSLGLSLLKETVARQGTGRIEGTVTDSEGRQLPFHSLKERQYLSIFGPLEVERAYYWHKGSAGVCPLDGKLNLPERKYSYLLEKWCQGAVAEGPYDEAVENLSDLLGLRVWKHGQEDVARDLSRDVEQFYRDKPSFDPASEGQMLCATLDCKGVAMVPGERPDTPKRDENKARRSKGEKKKGLRRDAVVTADFSFNPEKRTPEQMIEALMRTGGEKEAKDPDGVRPRSPLNKQVLADMSGKAKAVKLLAERIEKRDPTGKKPIYIQTDGDPALVKAVMSELGTRGWLGRIAGICLDIIHAMEYLWDAAAALYGERDPRREEWVRKQGLTILKGRVTTVVGSLRHTLTKRGKGLGASRRRALKRTITYLYNHRHMMDYDFYLKAGFPIATGVIEGTCGSLVKDRTDRSGMKWTRSGAQAVLHLRALKRNGDWSQYWDYYIQNEHQRLYSSLN